MGEILTGVARDMIGEFLNVKFGPVACIHASMDSNPETT